VRRRGPRPQLLLRSARPRSSRTGCGTAIALIAWSRQNLPTEPDLDPSRTDGDSSRQQRVGRHSFVRRAQGCPKPRARRRCGRPIRCCGPGMQPIPSIIPGGTQRAFHSYTNGRPSRRDRRPAGQSSLRFDCLRAIANQLRSVQRPSERGMRSGGRLPPLAPRSRTSAAAFLGRVEIRSVLTAVQPDRWPRKTTEGAGLTTESGLRRLQDGSCSPNGLGLALLDHWRIHGFCVPLRGPGTQKHDCLAL
jgi:hypothetical protein